MTEGGNTSPPSPDRKRSLQEESASDDDDNAGRFKRQAINSIDSSHPSPAKKDTSASESSKDNAIEDAAATNGTSTTNASAAASSSSPSGTGTAVTAAPPVDDSSIRAMAVRAIISTKEAGVVIGKNGKNVADIRDKSGAKVTVSEQIPGALERIITITGPLDQVAKAFSLVALKIVEEQTSTTADVMQRHTTVRILVPHSRMGSVIGKQGSKIKEIQDASGSRINASEDMLPHSTERIVSVQGVVDSIHIATYHIGVVLQDHPERSIGTIPYKPIPGVVTSTGRGGGASGASGSGGGGGPGQAPGMGVVPGMSGYGMPQSAGAYGAVPGAPQGSMMGYGYGMPGAAPGMHMMMPGGGYPHHGAQAGANQVQQIFIPNEMVGAIIGKGGAKINELRMLTGCQIKIMDPSEGSSERLVNITGPPESNQRALYMLYQRLESEKMRMQAGGRV